MALLETFVRIVEAGSLSAAAVQLGSTQPTVSRRLQALERLLGVRLLQRSTHAMTLTDDGARCYDLAKELVAGWQSCGWWCPTPSASTSSSRPWPIT